MTAIVTGGASGIGLGVSRVLASAGHDLVIVGRSPADRHATVLADLAGASSRSVSYVQGDVGDPATANSVLDHLRNGALPGPVHIVHAAVLAELASPDRGLAGYKDAMDVNALPLVSLTTALDPYLVEGSTVTLLSSEGPRRCVPGYAYVASSKAAAETIIRYLACDWGPRGVRANNVSAGPVLTEALRSVWPGAEENIAKVYRRTPVRQPVEPVDVGNVVAFLVSPAARCLTGQTLLVDSGAGLVP